MEPYEKVASYRARQSQIYMTIVVGRHAALGFGEVADRDVSQSGSPNADWHNKDLCGSTLFESISLHMLQRGGIYLIGRYLMGYSLTETNLHHPSICLRTSSQFDSSSSICSEYAGKEKIVEISCLKIHNRHGN